MIMSIYTFLFSLYAKETMWAQTLTTIFIVGAFFSFLRKIPAGTKAELLFMEKSTGCYWSDGFCLIPSIGHMFHHIGIYVLWNLKQAYEVGLQETTHLLNINHQYDQSRPTYNVKVETSLFRMELYRMINAITSWIFGFQKGHPELLYQRIGFRIILVAIIGVLIGNFVAPVTTHAKGRKEIIEATNQDVMVMYRGECAYLENSATALIQISSRPVRMEDILEEIEIEKNGSFHLSTWSTLLSTSHQTISPSITIKTTALGNGTICF